MSRKLRYRGPSVGPLPGCGRPPRRPRGLVLALGAAFLLLAASRASPALKLQGRGGAIDLVLIGYGVFQTNLTEDVNAFFDSSDHLPAEFTNRQILNLRMDGKLSDTVKLDARLLHDRENLRDWRYRIEIAGQRNQLGVGEREGAFTDTEFTRYDTPFYGFDGKLGLRRLTAQGFATSRNANYRVDRLRGTNLSGPYFLTVSPVLEGSERVAIEVRSRRDQKELLRSDLQRRGLDYRMDYSNGSIQFSEPVEAETFDGDPVQIVVEYQFRARPDAPDEYLAGLRLGYEPLKGVALGTSYLRSTGLAGGILGRQGLLGIDQSVRRSSFSLDNEMAGPGGAFLDPKTGAWRLSTVVKPVKGVEIGGRLRRVGAEFETGASPRLDGERNRQEWEVSTTLTPLASQQIRAGYGVKVDNFVPGPDADRTRMRILFAGWESRVVGWPLLRLRYERRLTSAGDGAAGERDSSVDTITADVEDDLGTLGWLGPTRFKGQYRYELAGDGDPDTRRHTHSTRLRLDTRPRKGLETYLEARYGLTRGSGPQGIDSRVLEGLLGGKYLLRSKLSVGASLRERSSLDRVGSGSRSGRSSAILDVSYEPSARLRGVLKYEWSLSHGDGSRGRSLYFQGQVVPVQGLTASVGYKLDDRGDSLGGLDGEYFVSLLYKHADRMTLFARAERGLSEERLPPFEATRADRRLWLLGVSFDLTRRWGALGEIKDEKLFGAVQSDRRALVLELSRSITHQLRLAAGVELTIDEQRDPGPVDRRRLYLKLIGRL